MAHMTTLDATNLSAVDQPPHLQQFSNPVRYGFALLMGVLAVLALYFDFPFAQIGIFQPMMYAAGLVVVCAVIDIPFRRLSYQLAMIALYVVCAATAFIAWFSDGSGISQDNADLVWKLAALFIFLFTLAAAVWNAPFKNFNSKVAAIPMMYIVLFAFVGCSIWTVVFSTSNARIYPTYTYGGFGQYLRLYNSDKWWIAVHNVLIYIGFTTVLAFVVGFLLAVFMDQKIRLEGLFRTIYLYPFALSFIVTGHVWAWILSPEYGLEKSVRQMGWTSFQFDWLTTNDKAIYCVVIAGLWQGTGLVMALMLAGLRGIDDEVWKAARVDGIPKWRTYWSIVIPMMRPVLITTFVIVASGAFRVYDVVVALTDGGPGISSTVPSQYVYVNLFSGNIAQGLAAATIMLLISAVILIPWVYVEFVKGKQTR
jgi:glucose/mannose transport system permease protein